LRSKIVEIFFASVTFVTSHARFAWAFPFAVALQAPWTFNYIWKKKKGIELSFTQFSTQQPIFLIWLSWILGNQRSSRCCVFNWIKVC
jgi:hypothetical protein